jgi:hypothetical protein
MSFVPGGVKAGEDTGQHDDFSSAKTARRRAEAM